MKKISIQLLSNIFFLCIIHNLSAQETKKESNFSAGYDTSAEHGFYMGTKDKEYLLNIAFYAQIRYNTNFRFHDSDSLVDFSTGFNMARARIFFEGNFTKKFYYHFRMNINPSGNFELFVAYLQWNFNKKMNLRAGKQFMALGREDWMYAENIASMEFSAHDFTYAIWTSFGLQFHHKPNDNFRYWLGVGNGAYGSRKSFPQPSASDIGLTGRFEWNVKGNKWGEWENMTGRKDSEFGVLVGLAGGQVFRFIESVIQTEAKNASQINLDLSVKGAGFYWFAQGSATHQDFLETAGVDYTAYGVYSTLGYWVSKKVFPYLRFDYVSAGDKSGTFEDYASPGVGVAFYPFHRTNRYKFSAEYNYLGATLNNTIVEPDGQLGLVESSFGPQQSFRVGMQFGF